MPITLTLDPSTTARLQQLADSRHQSPEAILHEALSQYLDRQTTAAAPSPEGRQYPSRHPVGGIITPV